MKSEVYKGDELPARSLDAAARVKKREDQLRRATRGLRTRVAKCVQFDGGIFEHLLRTVTNLSFKHYIKTKIKLAPSNVVSLITIHNAFVFVDSNSSVSATIQN
jgi:hypothetical protein